VGYRKIARQTQALSLVGESSIDLFQQTVITEKPDIPAGLFVLGIRFRAT
jgi:hypothetical protein